jgi:hypothetical protein
MNNSNSNNNNNIEEKKSIYHYIVILDVNYVQNVPRELHNIRAGSYTGPLLEL